MGYIPFPLLLFPPLTNFLSLLKGSGILALYNSVRSALRASLPDVDFEGITVRFTNPPKSNPQLWPCVGVSRSTAPRRKKSYWLDRENRRKFFCDFAQEMGFDPLQPENWVPITNAQIRAHNVRFSWLLFLPFFAVCWLFFLLVQGRGVLGPFAESLSRALADTFAWEAPTGRHDAMQQQQSWGRDEDLFKNKRYL